MFGMLAASAQPVSFSKQSVRGATVHVVTVNLNDEQVEVRAVLAPHGKTLGLGNLLGSPRPTAAITGTFFDPASGLIVGNIVSEGRLAQEGWVGSVLTIDKQRQGAVTALDGQMGRHMDWSPYDFAISGGPTLVHDGVVLIDFKGEGFRDRGLLGARQRAALGLTADNKMLMVTSAGGVSLHHLARIMRDLGAVNAINLDGGSSTALYYDGQTYTQPRRRLTNLVAVYTRGGAPSQHRNLGSQYARAYDYFKKGERCFARGDLVKAHSLLRKALAMAPDMARYWETLAQIEVRRRQPLEAARAYVKAGLLHLERSQIERAQVCADSAGDLAPDLPELVGLRSQLDGLVSSNR